MMPRPAVIHCTSPAPSLPLVAEAVAVLDGAGQHIGDGLDAAMRMPRKAGAIIVGTIVAEIVEQQERIELAGVAEAEGAVQLARRRLPWSAWTWTMLLDGTDGHDDLPALLNTRPL